MPEPTVSDSLLTDIESTSSNSVSASNEQIVDLEKGSPKIKEPIWYTAEGIRFLLWTFINTFATIAIVFTNKAIFKDPNLRRNQSTFAAFHFVVTTATLLLASRPTFALFVPRWAGIVKMLPLGLAMCFNVILPNLSLAHSSIAFYQIARILLTPLVALINWIVYRKAIPRNAVYCLLPICLGVGIVSYYDTKPSSRLMGLNMSKSNHNPARLTSPIGVFFAFTGVIASSLYTVWIGTYHEKFQMNSMQLLFNQAPISAFLLLYAIPFTDITPKWQRISLHTWLLILFSGLMAACINISQFFIVAGAGPVSSTIIGHVKTCSIVALGWTIGGGAANSQSLTGIFMAIGGIFLYSIVMQRYRLQQLGKPEDQECRQKSRG